tara:strand:- start:37 stop:828 length:792 start_codon:yes stop_codon:yes gene_type:complete
MTIFLTNIFARSGGEDPFIYSIFGLIGGIVFLVMGLKKLKLKRMIMDLPTSKIKSLAMGFVEVTGKVKEAEDLFKSPLKQKECVYFDIHVEKWVSRGKNSRWETVYRDSETSLFYLTEENEKVLIDTQAAELNFKKDIDLKTGTFGKMPDYIQEFCEQKEIGKSIFGLKQKLRFREIYIEPNDELYILGTAMKNDKMDKISDSGTVKIGKSLDHPLFYISDYSEKEILSQFGWKVPLQIFGGGAVAIGSFAFIIIYSIKNKFF